MSLIRSFLEGSRVTNNIQAIASKLIEKGTTNVIHPPKLTAFSPTNYFMATTLGGELMGVPIPPMFAANGMHRTRAVLPKSSFGKSRRTGVTIVIINAVVAVLLMNIEKTAVMTIIPSMTNFGDSPKGLRNTRVKFTSR